MKKHLALVLLFCSFFSFSQKFDKKITDLISNYESQVIDLRHWFHENAELSNREFKTSERIAEELRKIGLNPQTGVAKTGVVALLEGGRPGPVVALRADIDGLPVKERADITWASKMTGEYNGDIVPVMHACGHDTHTAILLGVAKVLYDIKDQIPGSVKFIFQPAEEGAPKGEEGGAELMVKEGVLKNPDVDAIFGLHIAAGLDAGKITYKSGGIMAAAQSYQINVKGKQAHGSRPWASVDPILASVQIINGLQTIISRESELTKEGAVITVGMINAGIRSNIIPENATIIGTIRTLDYEMQDFINKRMKEMVPDIAKAFRAEATIEIDKGYPITFNHLELTSQMLPTLQRIASKENVLEIDAITGAEDFSFFQQKIPGLYFFLGGKALDVKPEEAAGHHTPDFMLDESGFVLGVKTLSALALDYLEQ